MKLIEKTHQHRRDFSGILQCEGCNHKQKLNSGYDDTFYHKEVIPKKIKCDNCNKTSQDLGLKGTTTPDVPSNVIL